MAGDELLTDAGGVPATRPLGRRDTAAGSDTGRALPLLRDRLATGLRLHGPLAGNRCYLSRYCLTEKPSQDEMLLKTPSSVIQPTVTQYD